MSLCVILNCHNTKSGGYTLFKLPNEGEKSRSKWIQFIKICGVDTDNLKNEFIKAVHDNIIVGINHCDGIFHKFLILFYERRSKISHQIRLPHRREKIASKFA
ncbi:hypothetical protein PVAND_014711 [Polypedilum vanderplanki]|uniref:THAP-type domain-containing protein n=1 Tax=Polypedilum vanderplanki TaxID=319348 RepID=A0A9J6BAT9_POLVA|nr:hypothetical protein PVAND_014711 [Polypedilum vanderplanki]